MHRGDGGTHNDGAGNLARRCPFGLLSKIKYEYQGGKRKCDRKRNGQGHKEGMKPEYRSQTHGRHADVMHGCNTAAHNHAAGDRKSTRLNSSHSQISYAVFCLKKKKASSCKLSTPMHGKIAEAKLSVTQDPLESCKLALPLAACARGDPGGSFPHPHSNA